MVIVKAHEKHGPGGKTTSRNFFEDEGKFYKTKIIQTRLIINGQKIYFTLLICAIHSCFSVAVAAYTANDLPRVQISQPFLNWPSSSMDFSFTWN